MNEVQGCEHSVCSMSIVRPLYDLTCVTDLDELEGVSDRPLKQVGIAEDIGGPPLLRHVIVQTLCFYRNRCLHSMKTAILTPAPCSK